MTIADRLSEKLLLVDSGCWEFVGAISDGYGTIRYNGRVHKSHRVSWEIENGPIPEGMCVLHHCDNPTCCNPKHLFLGTKKDNSDDMISKGRDYHNPEWIRGEANGHAKLLKSDVLEIKQLLNEGYTQQSIADAYGCSRENIKKIKLGHSWGWL